MRLVAGYLSGTMLLLMIGYVIGYAVCLWRYVDTGDTPIRKATELSENRTRSPNTSVHSGRKC